MKKELKDYIHLYLGCEVLVQNKKYTLVEVSTFLILGIQNSKDDYFREVVDPSTDLKLILRPLSDMTKEEIQFIGIDLKAGTMNAEAIKYSFYRWTLVNTTPNVFAFLLSKHFDLFNLILAGLAIDKNTLK